MGSKLTWKYDKMGHVSVWKGEVDYTHLQERHCDMYIQNDTNVKIFFGNIGIDMKDLNSGVWDVAEDVGYFIDSKSVLH